MKKTMLWPVIYMTGLFTATFTLQCLTMSFLFAWNGDAQVKSIEKIKFNKSLEEVSVEMDFSELVKNTSFSFIFATREINDLPLTTFQSSQDLDDILLIIAPQDNLIFKQLDA